MERQGLNFFSAYKCTQASLLWQVFSSVVTFFRAFLQMSPLLPLEVRYVEGHFLFFPFFGYSRFQILSSFMHLLKPFDQTRHINNNTGEGLYLQELNTVPLPPHLQNSLEGKAGRFAEHYCMEIGNF